MYLGYYVNDSRNNVTRFRLISLKFRIKLIDMRTLEKIIIAGVVGTSLMTLYSYLISERENEQFREPELLNSLIDRSKILPKIQDKRIHPAGWSAHYSIGILFVSSYYFLWKKMLCKPTVAKTLITGSVSGLIGIASWKFFFSQHDNPPSNDRAGYYKQLFVAHIIFTVTAVLTYKNLGQCKKNE